MIELKVSIDNIQYGDLAKQFVPQLIEHFQKNYSDSKVISLLSGMKNMPGSVVKTMLDALPQDTKDEMAVYFINQNREALLDAVSGFMKEKGIEADWQNFHVEKIETFS